MTLLSRARRMGFDAWSKIKGTCELGFGMPSSYAYIFKERTLYYLFFNGIDSAWFICKNFRSIKLF
jgi:hypothetical protein